MKQTISSKKNFRDQIEKIIHVSHHCPHAFLGLQAAESHKVIRLWRPGAQHTLLEIFGAITETKKIHEAGLFEYQVPVHTTFLDYRVYHQNGRLAHDLYAFERTFGELDEYLFAKGTHYELFNRMGGRLTEHQGVLGAKFSVWAPNAKSVSVVGDFNYWDGRVNPMRVLGSSGVWEIFIPGLTEGQKYKFEIQTQQEERILKSDPYALLSEVRPLTASVLTSSDDFVWNDQKWMKNRTPEKSLSGPMMIYEVHLGSWKKKESSFMNYRDLAHELTEYCQKMSFNFIELLPIQEHPFDQSWGYQTSGYYAPTSRFGTPRDFKYFVNYLHEHGIGIILDWVPGHFPTDSFSLGKFDGSPLYEHADPREGYHPHWHTYIFNFGRHEVTNFLIANALFWFEEMHVDALRVDAVASMLYLDYGREGGQWIPNIYGGKENLQAIEFIKHFNSIVHKRCPGALTIAEESTAFLGVTHSVEQGGLGFDLKWNMGWMNDTLRYFSKDCYFRAHHQHDLTFGLLYAFSEQYILVFSHDEVVHGKKNMISKMPGDMWQQFANLRLLFTYMICQPGKKLLFMGTEIAQWNEWNCDREIEWFLLTFPTHSGIQRLVQEINHFYFDHPALWSKDFHHDTFEWIDFQDTQNSVITYLRKGNQETLLCVHNFTPSYLPHYIIHVPAVQQITEVFNSDAERYGGSNQLNPQPQIIPGIGIQISLAPLATMIFAIKP